MGIFTSPRKAAGRPSTYRRSSAAIPSSFSAATTARRSRFALTRPSQDSIRAAAASDCLAMMATRVKNVLKFLRQYQLEFQRTQAFCNKLKDLNLLEPMQAQITLGSGQRMALGGFTLVDRARLKTLSGNVLAQLVQSDELELIYAHLVSMRNFATVRDRLAETQLAHGAGSPPLAP